MGKSVAAVPEAPPVAQSPGGTPGTPPRVLSPSTTEGTNTSSGVVDVSAVVLACENKSSRGNPISVSARTALRPVSVYS